MATRESPKKVARIPLVGNPHHRSAGTALYINDTIDQKLINCTFKEFKNPFTGDSWYSVQKRPGLGTATSYSTNADYLLTATHFPVNPSTAATNIPISLYGYNSTLSAQLYKNTTQDGTASNPTTVSAIAKSSLLTPCLYNSNYSYLYWLATNSTSDREAYVYDMVAAAHMQITDADFPVTTLASNFVYKNGRAFVLTSDGKLYNSALNDVTSWDATAYISTSRITGVSTALAEHLGKLVAFSNDTIDVYTDVGNPTGSVLQRDLDKTLVDYGVTYNSLSPKLPNFTQVLNGLNTVFWINSATTTTGVGVYKLDGFTPVKISSPDIDALIVGSVTGSGGGFVSTALHGPVKVGGLTYILLFLNAESVLAHLAYCVEQNSWVHWQYGAITKTTRHALVPYTGDAFYLYADTSRYTIDTRNAVTYSDAGTAVTLTAQTRLLDFGSNRRKRIDKLRVVGNAGSGTISLSWTKDDYANFTTARTASFSNNAATFTNLGMGRRWGFKIEHSAAAYCQIDWLEIEYTELDK